MRDPKFLLALLPPSSDIAGWGDGGLKGRSHKLNRGVRLIGASSEFGHVGQAGREAGLKEPLRRYMEGGGAFVNPTTYCAAAPKSRAPGPKSMGAPSRMGREGGGSRLIGRRLGRR